MGGKNVKILRRNGRRLIQMKVKKLRKIVPGGQGVNPDTLLLRAADYISLLRLQINILKNLIQTP
ncbi:hypothetical protein CASFOL_009704 [Castilleja foliolosa]|uniref:Uncharacterized protein n=1 Tax=Castilleja foliolosa TaxID=1961234 RepID=A0ABD3DU32_9LAMI